MRLELMKSDPRFIDVEKSTLRGLSCTEIVQMLQRRKGRTDSVPALDPNLLRDIGLDRGAC